MQIIGITELTEACLINPLMRSGLIWSGTCSQNINMLSLFQHRWILVYGMFAAISWNCTDSTSKDISWILGPFEKLDSVNPILGPSDTLKFHCPVVDSLIGWAEKDVFNPAVVTKGDTVCMIFRAEDMIGKYHGTSRLGLAMSSNGYHFIADSNPILYPDHDSMFLLEWEGGIEDPRVVEREDGLFVMTYTAYDGDRARLCVASSPDLRHWTKHGLVLGDQHKDTWSKAGAIVCSIEEGRLKATQIDGRYWMYWGDKHVYACTSKDLIHWDPVYANDGELHIVFGPRKGFFDSDLVEPGPSPILTADGIVLLYNSRNAEMLGDDDLPAFTYSAGQILLDKDDPLQVLDRTDSYFIRPDRPYEISGQIDQVVFIQGMVIFQDHWWLYYGTADSKIAVATAPFDD